MSGSNDNRQANSVTATVPQTTEIKTTGVKTRPRESLAKQTLLQMALWVTPIVFAMSILSYWHIVSTLEEQTIDKLAKYISERSSKENSVFELAMSNHQLFSKAFLTLYTTASHQELVKDFDKYHYQPGT